MKFAKMHGIGNDYIYVNCFEEKVLDPSSLAKKISDRHRGVGSDGLILILPSKKADFRMRMFNADGSEGEMCGNGIRCFARYVYDKAMTSKKEITIETLAGIRIAKINTKANGSEVWSITIDMGEPILDAKKIPFKGVGRIIEKPLKAGGKNFLITAVSMGNPHCIIFVKKADDALVKGIGPLIEKHPSFPKRVNAEFIVIKSRKEVSMRVWERGSGETQACGTGASAVCVAGVLSGKTERKIIVHLLGGDLQIEWAENNRVYMSGPAEWVCEGEFLG